MSPAHCRLERPVPGLTGQGGGRDSVLVTTELETQPVARPAAVASGPSSRGFLRPRPQRHLERAPLPLAGFHYWPRGRGE